MRKKTQWTITVIKIHWEATTRTSEVINSIAEGIKTWILISMIHMATEIESTTKPLTGSAIRRGKFWRTESLYLWKRMDILKVRPSDLRRIAEVNTKKRISRSKISVDPLSIGKTVLGGFWKMIASNTMRTVCKRSLTSSKNTPSRVNTWLIGNWKTPRCKLMKIREIISLRR